MYRNKQDTPSVRMLTSSLSASTTSSNAKFTRSNISDDDTISDTYFMTMGKMQELSQNETTHMQSSWYARTCNKYPLSCGLQDDRTEP